MNDDNSTGEKLSIGSDESGNGGLFCGCCFACFNLNKKNLKKIKEQAGYLYLEGAKDAKNMDYHLVTHLAGKIKKLFKQNKDYFIGNMSVDKWNQIYLDAGRSQEDKVKGIAHRYIHRQIKSESDLHVIDKFIEKDNYLFKNVNGYDRKFIDECDFCEKAESKYLSVSIAAILAKAEYLGKLGAIQLDLGVSIRNSNGYNQNSSPKKFDSVFLELQTKGKDREEIFNKYCKLNKVKEYKEKLKNYLGQKKKC